MQRSSRVSAPATSRSPITAPRPTRPRISRASRPSRLSPPATMTVRSVITRSSTSRPTALTRTFTTSRARPSALSIQIRPPATTPPGSTWHKAGIDVDSFFGKSIITGSHENGVIALDKGTVDCAADWWNADDDSNLTRMVKKGMAKKEDFRIIFKSELLPGSPYAYLSSLPDDLKQSIEQAFMAAPTKDKAAFDRLSDGKDKEFVAVTHKDYQGIVGMIQFVDEMRKKRS